MRKNRCRSREERQDVGRYLPSHECEFHVEGEYKVDALLLGLLLGLLGPWLSGRALAVTRAAECRGERQPYEGHPSSGRPGVRWLISARPSLGCFRATRASGCLDPILRLGDYRQILQRKHQIAVSFHTPCAMESCRKSMPTERKCSIAMSLLAQNLTS